MEEDPKKGETEEKIISLPKGKREFNATLFGETIQKGFAKLFKDQSLSDITLLVGEEKIPAHRLVLCAWSDTFRAMLETGAWAESDLKELRINVEPDDYAHFKLVLEYMYNGNSDFVDDDNVMPIIALTNYYGIHALKEVCGKLLGEQISEANIFYLLDVVDKYDCKRLAGHCGEFLAANFSEMWEEDRKRLLTLSVETWVAMLQSDDLLVSNEQDLYEITLTYAAQFDDDKEKKGQILEALLPQIRWCYIPMRYLTEVVEKDKFVSNLPIMHSLLFENYRYQAYKQKQPSFSTNRRTGQQRWDKDAKGFNVQLSEDAYSATFVQGGWESARVTVPFNNNYVYCEFKCEAITNVMIGAANGTVPYTGYAGQYANGFTQQSSGGNFYNSGGVTNQGMSQAWASGDVVGVGYDRTKGMLYYYKNGAPNGQQAGIPSDSAQVYAIVSGAGSNRVSLVANPVVPTALEHLVDKKSLSKKEKKDDQATPTQGFTFGMPQPTPTPPFGGLGFGRGATLRLGTPVAVPTSSLFGGGF